MNILAMAELVADLPVVQEPVAAAVATEVKKVVKDAAGQKAVKDLLTNIASKL